MRKVTKKMSEFRDEAIQLANRQYAHLVFLDEATDDTSIYIALNPELDGCISQGDTPREAIQNLSEARIDYIESILEDGLVIPEPSVAENGMKLSLLDLMGYEHSEDTIDDANAKNQLRAVVP